MSANNNNDSAHPSSTRLSYTVAGCSEHSNRYGAENIMVDAPTDPNSRWSGLHENPSIKQWIILRLDTLSVIGEIVITLCWIVTQVRQDNITFGKVRAFSGPEAHPANRHRRVPILSVALQTWVISVFTPMTGLDPDAQNTHAI